MSKVFAIGLSKTATTSLTSALRILDYKTKHFPFGMLRLRKGKLRFNMRKAAKYDALTDIPIARFYKELDKEFPGSKFILTIRNKKKWLRSCKNHFWFGKFYPYKHPINQLHKDFFKANKYVNKKDFEAAYDKHLREVREHFKDRPGDLLILDIPAGEGWAKLCPFLQKEIPSKPFPKRNTTRGNPHYYAVPNLLYKLFWKKSQKQTLK